MSEHVPAELRRLVEQDSGGRCGYCLTPHDYFSLSLEVEHIVPRSRGGRTERANLWVACATCNRFKGAQTEAIDPSTGEEVALFNPRTGRWSECFEWSANGLFIIGRNATGRATVEAMQLNHPRWIACRNIWRLAHVGFPPEV